ncbi:MAG: hypothetical protein ABSG69_00470 [Candidatus Acidiferrum sp.]|jgi:hypothetical protein
MAKTSAATKEQLQFAELLRLGGKKIPAGLAGKAAAASKALRQKQFNAATDKRRRAAKLQSEVSGAAPAGTNKKVLDEILSQHKRLASKKLAFPKVPVGIGGIWPGTISGTALPPFDFADTIPTILAGATPTLSVSASVNGQISASAATVQSGFNGGSEYARVGIFFHPTAPGTLTISSSPTYSFEWVTNSLGSSFVDSEGSVGLDIYGMNELGEILSSTGANYKSWQELATGQVNLDFGSDITGSLSVSLEVNPGQVYLCFVEVDAHVAGDGWMGIPNNQSLAVAMASATVPSISYEFRPLLLNHP